MRYLVLTILFFGLLGCAHSTVHNYQRFDPTDKSITLPLGAAEPLGDIKDGFAKRGYRIVTTNDSVVTVKTDEKTSISSPENKTRYRLIVHTWPAELWCVATSGEVNYELSLVDLRSGQEVLTMAGKECPGHTAPKFFEAIGLK